MPIASTGSYSPGLHKAGPIRTSQIFLPIVRAFSQLDDPDFRGVLLRGLGWSVLCIIALHVGAIWAVHRLLTVHGLLGWAVDFLGSIGAALLAYWLFVPIATGIGTLYFDRIAAAVEARFYPWLAHAESASIAEQIWAGIAVALKVLGLNIVALILAILIPGVGLLLGWIVAAYAIGHGLFIAVAMRRMPHHAAQSLYRSRRGTILAQGAIIAIFGYVPIMNLLIPVIGVAAMVHVLALGLAKLPGAERQ